MESNELDDYERKYHLSAGECWLKVMQRWIEGQGTAEYPVGWEGLYEMLRDVSMSQIALDLKKAVDNH